MLQHLLIACLLSFSATVYAANDVAKVIIVRGSAMAQSPDGKVTQIVQGMWFKEGTQVKTADKSFVKLLFIDKSQMNLGPNSQMKIDKFPESEPGIVTLVKGQLRSKVSKNYMEMSKKDKSKLFIKTKTAAMGVRGTDFQVNYNPENSFTSLVTFEGAVAMASLDSLSRESVRDSINQVNLERLVSSNQAVIVTRGQFSGSSPETGAATIPVKLNPMQVESMEKDTSGMDEQDSTSAVTPAKSIVPPGVSGEAFSNKPKVDSQVDASVTAKAETGAKLAVQGFANTKNLNNAASGAIVDVVTSKLLLPPKNSPIDKNTGIPVITGTASVLSAGGKVNLEAAKKINVVVVELKTANDVAVAAKVSGRAPASITESQKPAKEPKQNDDIVKLAEELIVEHDGEHDDDLDLGATITRTRTRIDLNIQ